MPAQLYRWDSAPGGGALVDAPLPSGGAGWNPLDTPPVRPTRAKRESGIDKERWGGVGCGGGGAPLAGARRPTSDNPAWRLQG